MPVAYNNKKIIPAPLFNIEKQYQTTPDGTKIGSLYSITCQGTLVAYMGSPDSQGEFWDLSGYPPDESISQDSRLKSILTKQVALQALMSVNGQSFEILPYDGSSPLKFHPRVARVRFQEGIWTDRCEYTIEMEADVLYLNGQPISEDEFDEKIANATESWTIELGDQSESPESPQSFRLTHNISAVGKSYYGADLTLEMPAWQQAKNWVVNRLGLDNSVIASTGVLNVPSYYNGFNHVRSEQKGIYDGSYSVTESWVLTSGNAIEDFTISTTQGITDGLTRVTINGSINGLETRNSNYQITTSKWAAASGKYEAVKNQIFGRAQYYSDVSLNVTPAVIQVGRNPLAGTITYNYDFDNRPSPCIPGARSEIITIVDNNPIDIFASVPVLGRLAGPVLQPINTISESQRQLNVELILPSSGQCSTLEVAFQGKPNIQRIINAATGTLTFTQIFKNTDQESWNPLNGTYSRQLGWTWQ